VSSTSWNERRIAGSLLLLGFGLLLVTALLYQPSLDDPAMGLWKRDALAGGLIVTMLGLATLELALSGAGQQVLGRLGAVAYLLGAVPWLVAESMGTYTSDVERNYVVLACLSVAAIGWATLRARLLPVVAGWTTIAWAVTWAVLYLGRVGVFQAPLGPNLAILVIALFLLFPRATLGAGRGV